VRYHSLHSGVANPVLSFCNHNPVSVLTLFLLLTIRGWLCLNTLEKYELGSADLPVNQCNFNGFLKKNLRYFFAIYGAM